MSASIAEILRQMVTPIPPIKPTRSPLVIASPLIPLLNAEHSKVPRTVEWRRTEWKGGVISCTIPRLTKPTLITVKTQGSATVIPAITWGIQFANKRWVNFFLRGEKPGECKYPEDYIDQSITCMVEVEKKGLRDTDGIEHIFRLVNLYPRPDLVPNYAFVPYFERGPPEGIDGVTLREPIGGLVFERIKNR